MLDELKIEDLLVMCLSCPLPSCRSRYSAEFIFHIQLHFVPFPRKTYLSARKNALARAHLLKNIICVSRELKRPKAGFLPVVLYGCETGSVILRENRRQWAFSNYPEYTHSRFQWPRGLRCGSAAASFLGLWVRIPPGTWMFVSCECCVFSGRGLCVGPISCPEKFYRL